MVYLLFRFFPLSSTTSQQLLSLLLFSLLSHIWLCYPMDCSMPDSPVLRCLLKSAQARVHWVDDAIQPSHPLPSPSPSAFSLSQHQGLFQWVSFSYQGVKILELLLQHESFQWIFRVDFSLGLTGLICLLSKGLSRVFLGTTIEKHQFFDIQSSLWSNSHICTWLLEKL